MDSMSGGEPGIHFESPLPTNPESVEPGSDEKFERRPSQQESAPSKTPAQAMPQLQLPTLPGVPSTQPQTDDDATQASTPTAPAPTADLQTDGGDVIEKSWVDRTKSVISKTRNDPYSQKEAVSQIKADYIQKRYKRQPKTDDTVAA